jgi:hypothetical protein
MSARPAIANDPLDVLSDGNLARSYGPVFGNGVRQGAYRLDLGAVKPVAAITSWSFNQNGNRGRQLVTIFGSDSPTDPGWNTKDRSRFVPLETIDTASLPSANFSAASLRARSERTLGNFRWIVWSVDPVTELLENTAFQELEVTVVP